MNETNQKNIAYQSKTKATRSVFAFVMSVIAILVVAAYNWSPTQHRTLTESNEPLSTSDPGQANQGKATITPGKRQEPAANMALIDLPSHPSKTLEGTVNNVLAELGQLYQNVTPMDFDAAKMLIQQRKEKAAQLAQDLATLGDDAVPSILLAYNDAQNGKLKLLLLEALSLNENESGVLGLTSIVRSETAFSFKENAMNAIADHSSSKTESILTNLLANEQDDRLKVVALQGLSRFPTSLQSVESIVTSDSSDLLKLESVRSVGKMGTDDAFHSLERIVREHQSETIRIHAVMELARSFAGKAEPVLSPLLQDADTEMSKAAKRAIDMMKRQLSAPDENGLPEYGMHK